MMEHHDVGTMNDGCHCPACHEDLDLVGAHEWDVVACEICRGEFQIMSLDPPDLLEVSEGPDDWEEE